MAMDEVDLFVIGAGSGGTRAARIAAGHGAKVAIAEHSRVGGTCVIRGCVPKKLMVYASSYGEVFHDAADYGWRLDGAAPAFDWPAFQRKMLAEVERLSQIYIRNIKASGVELHHERAVVIGPNTVRLEDSARDVHARKILVATGGHPFTDIGIPGVEHVITSDDIFGLPALPDRVVIAGGGYIGVEFSFILNGMGVDTTLIHRGPKVLQGFDEDLRDRVMEELETAGIDLVLSDVFTRIEKVGETLHLHTRGGRTLHADHCLLAVGRRPNTKGLGLEEVGVHLDAMGAVVVDEAFRSSVPSIFAVGDATATVHLTPVAIREGQTFAENEFGGRDGRVDHADIATAVFAQPELGTVGLSEAEARARCRAVDVYRTSFRTLHGALTTRADRMFMKLVVDHDTNRVVGAHVVGHGAAEMVQLLGVALKMGATKADLDRTIAVHPTAAEEWVTMRMAPQTYVRDAAE